MKQISTILFGLTMLLYLWFPFNMIQGAQRILNKGSIYKFKPMPVDPYDAFRGRYVTLRFNEGRIAMDNPRENFERNQEVYVLLEKDEQGFAQLTSISPDLPKGQDYLATTIRNIGKDYVNIRFPNNLTRYYINEKLAPLAEDAYRKLSRENRQEPDSVSIFLEASVYEGQAVIKELYLKGKPVEEYLINEQ